MAFVLAFALILAFDHAGPCEFSGEPYLRRESGTDLFVLDGAAVKTICPIH